MKPRRLLFEATPEPTPEGGGGEGEDRPDWLPDQFTSGEALAKSYSESRKEMDRLRSQLATEQEQFAAALERIEAVTQQPPQQQPGLDPQTNQLLAQYQDAVERQDAAAQLAITLGLQQQLMTQALDERFSKLTPQIETAQKADRDIAFRMAEGRVAARVGKEEWDVISNDVNSWLREHPAWLPAENTPDAFEAVIGEATRYVQNEKKAEQLAALEADRAARLSAQTATGSVSGRHPTVTDEKKQEWDAVKQAQTGSYSEIARQ